MDKPFLEKSFDTKIKSTYIYYPISDGGGCKKYEYNPITKNK